MKGVGAQSKVDSNFREEAISKTSDRVTDSAGGGGRELKKKKKKRRRKKEEFSQRHDGRRAH